jgi:5-methylthioribose kinase
VRPFDREGVCPQVHAFVAGDRVLVLEDLGDAPRLDALLAGGPAPLDAVRRLAGFLGRVHAGTRGAALGERFRNEAMQRLHGEHIFRLPLAPNDFPLPPRTRERARALWERPGLRETAERCYRRYLTPEGALVHGDVQAGNVLVTASGPRLLDAEIAHVGDPAFDVGTLVAHLALAAVAAGRPAGAAPAVAAAWSAYRDAHGDDGRPDFGSVARYAGLELLRRTIGAARVAAVAEDAAGLRAVAAALPWIEAPPSRPEGLLAA